MADLPKEVFISYSRQNSLRPFVTKLKHDLEAEGLTVWLDIEDIPGGSDRNAVTGAALHNCTCLVAILSNCYISSKYSTSELYSADADDKNIIPIVFEPVDYKQSQKAMGVKYVIGGLQPISCIPDVDDYNTSVKKLVTGVQNLSKSQHTDLSSQMARLRVSEQLEATPTAPLVPPPQYNDIYPDKQDSIDGSSYYSFRVGMKLEAVDRRFPFYVCVATIAHMRDDQIKIHFDGWGPEYDYWCTNDMIELHPVGWCARNGHELQPPRGLAFSNWNKYLSDTQAEPCDAPMFNDIQNSSTGSLYFRVGMKLEAKDRKHPSLTCVASIIDINDINGQLLIHFDGWSEEYDYWCEPDSTDIHPPMWCNKHHKQLQPPNNHHGAFRWNQYLAEPANNPAPFHVFKEEQLVNN